ncbi:hypothetical protein [Melittangium boletus]|uniref:hypothetical protein n=1 Tax=Melittangium boletus TaxID=83453 RepID=UPI003DA260F8
MEDALLDLLDHDQPGISGAAACALGHINYESFLNEITRRAEKISFYSQTRRQGFRDGLIFAVKQIREAFYGSMCPGIVNIMEDDPDAAHYHYMNILETSKAAIELFEKDSSGLELQRLLDSIYEIAVDGCSDEPELLASLRSTKPFYDPRQLSLFDKDK